MSVDLAALVEIAEHAADTVATALAAPDARAGLDVSTKSSATDLVTARDRWAENTIVEILGRERPGDGILGEEGTERGSRTGVVWVIDPIDGTTNFVRDLPGFSVSIAARLDGVDVVGVIADPVRGDRYRATLGGGAFCNGDALRVSESRRRAAERRVRALERALRAVHESTSTALGAKVDADDAEAEESDDGGEESSFSQRAVR